MKFSLSVRIVEAACKTRLNIPFGDFVAIARDTGFDAICMRASAGGVETPLDELSIMREVVEAAGLDISMVTADYNVPLNNHHGPDSLRNITPSLDVAAALGADLVRVCLKSPDDIPYAREAADRAAERRIRLAHQCHTSSIFEAVDRMLQVLAEIGRDNFGLIYEPANLMLCGQPYGLETLRRLQPHLMNVYVQNHRLDPAGPVELDTFCRGPVRFHHLAPWDSGGVDFQQVFDALGEIEYDGYFTMHQAQGIETQNDALVFAEQSLRWARQSAS